MNENKLKRLFPNASKSFVKLNKDNPANQGSPNQPEPLDRLQVGEDKREKAFYEEYCLSLVQIEFFANHGQKLDDDNRGYIIKPILDGLVSLGIAKTDANIKSEVTQRFNESDINIS